MIDVDFLVGMLIGIPYILICSWFVGSIVADLLKHHRRGDD